MGTEEEGCDGDRRRLYQGQYPSHCGTSFASALHEKQKCDEAGNVMSLCGLYSIAT